MALWIRGALGAILFLIPLPFGAVEAEAIFAFETATLVLLALHLVAKSGRSEAEPRGGRANFPRVSKILAAVFLGLAAFQILPLPYSLLKILSPSTYALRAEALAVSGQASGGGRWGPLSLAPSASIDLLVLIVCYFLFGYLVWSYARTGKDLSFFVWALLAGAVFQSLYGLAGLLSGSQTIWGYPKIDDRSSASGTFINRNHFSGYLEMIFPVSVGFILATSDFFSRKAGGRLKEKILWLGHERRQKAFLLSLLSVLIGIGIIFSFSRMGIFVFFATIFLFLLALSAFGVRRKRSIKIIRTILLVILAAVAVTGVDPIFKRFADENMVKDIRATFFADTIALIGRFPSAGVGLGGFVQAYPTVQKIYNPNLVDHAHNDYLELAGETGLIAALALAAAAAIALGWAFRKWRERRDPFVRGVSLGAILGVTALLIHSLIDFNLQIPANAATFAAVFALAMAGADCGRNGANGHG